jgi:hypothetical protein
MTKVNALDKGYVLYQQDMDNIRWENASQKGSCSITKETWDTKTMKVARETEMQLQELTSNELEEKDEFLEEKTHFATPTVPKQDSDELKNTNSDDLVSSLSPNKGNSKGQPESPVTSQSPSIEESQVPQDEDDLPIVLHAENLGRKNGTYAPFFISLIVNELILHNCLLDLGASTNIMPLRITEQLGLEIS